MRIAILEDDRTQAYVLKHCLTQAGHESDRYDSGRALLEAFTRAPFDLLLLDWNVPDITGVEVLNEVRKSMHSNVPAMVITSRDSEEDIVHALAQGADDYIQKPIRSRELLARIGALVRVQQSHRREDIIEQGNVRLDVTSRVALVRGNPVALSVKDFDLAVHVFRNIGRVLSRSQLVEDVWQGTVSAKSRTLDTHMSRIRVKLELDPPHWHLNAIYGHGYRLERTV